MWDLLLISGNMAWLQYVDNMKASGHVSQGAVLGVDGSEWACSPDLQVTHSDSKV